LNCTGIPDGQTGNSVTQCIKSSVTITKPTGLAEGALWDCHIVMAPFFYNSASRISFNASRASAGQNLLNNTTDITGDRVVAPVTCVKYPTGYAGNYTNPFTGPAPSTGELQTSFCDLNGVYTNGDYRVISQGFEVLNTTNALDVQGLCTVYRTPVETFNNASVMQLTQKEPVSGDLKSRGSFSGLLISRVPDTPSQALKLPNTKQWLAKEGCYVVAHLNDPETLINNRSYVQPMFATPQPGLNNTIDFNIVRPSPYVNTGVVPADLAWPSMTWGKMDISGAFFTGLKETTTLTINWNIYIERFPSEDESELVVLAKPSPDFCPMAFELYKAISQELPVGVMQKENGLGDWFRDAVSTASEFISPIAAMIPHPAAQAVSGISKMVGGMAKRQESQSPYVSEQGEKAFVSRPRLARSPVRSSRTIKEEVKKEAKKEAKKEIKPFLKRSTMSVMPSAKKANRK
jgi:hypothetical protein